MFNGPLVNQFIHGRTSYDVLSLPPHPLLKNVTAKNLVKTLGSHSLITHHQVHPKNDALRALSFSIASVMASSMFTLLESFRCKNSPQFQQCYGQNGNCRSILSPFWAPCNLLVSCPYMHLKINTCNPKTSNDF